MKKLTLFMTTIIVSLLSYCSDKQLTREEIVVKNIEELIKPQMNDPDSYEFVKLELIDSISFNDNINSTKENFKFLSYEQSLRFYKTSSDIKKVNNYKKILKKIDSIENSLGDKKNEIASYTYAFSFRGNNAFGAKVLNTYFAQTDTFPYYNIQNVVEEMKKLYISPNRFPGYEEIKEMQKN